MDKDIEWLDDTNPGNEKYPQLLAQIKGEQLASTRHRGMWAKLAAFDNGGTARDLAYRLGKRHEEFDFVSRKLDTGEVAVYARLKEGVDA